MVDTTNPHLFMKALLEFQARTLVMSQSVTSLLYNKLADKEKGKKVMEEPVAAQKKANEERAEWAKEK